MTKLRQFLGGLICALCGWMLTACSSEEDSLQIPEGKGYVKLNLTTDAGFQTKAALDEAPYKDANNYTVQILKDGKVVSGCEWKYSEMPSEPIALSFNSYVVKAFYGTDFETVSQDHFYSEGTANLKLDPASEQPQSVNITCQATCAKLTVKYDDAEIKKYFEGFNIGLSTQALGSGTYSYANTDPIYLKVTNGGEQISVTYTFTGKDSYKDQTILRKYTLKPGQSKLVTITPTVTSGKLSLTIKVDETVETIDCPIEIPSDWI